MSKWGAWVFPQSHLGPTRLQTIPLQNCITQAIARFAHFFKKTYFLHVKILSDGQNDPLSTFVQSLVLAAASLWRTQSEEEKHEDSIVEHHAGEGAPLFSLSRSSFTVHLEKKANVNVFPVQRPFLF